MKATLCYVPPSVNTLRKICLLISFSLILLMKKQTIPTWTSSVEVIMHSAQIFSVIHHPTRHQPQLNRLPDWLLCNPPTNQHPFLSPSERTQVRKLKNVCCLVFVLETIKGSTQCGSAAVGFINALSTGAWHRHTGKLTMRNRHKHPHNATINTHTYIFIHTLSWRLMLCSSVSLLPGFALHKSQQERRQRKKKDAYVKTKIETKALWDVNIPWHEHRQNKHYHRVNY